MGRNTTIGHISEGTLPEIVFIQSVNINIRPLSLSNVIANIIATFLVLNTAGVTLLPTTLIALRSEFSILGAIRKRMISRYTA